MTKTHVGVNFKELTSSFKFNSLPFISFVFREKKNRHYNKKKKLGILYVALDVDVK